MFLLATANLAYPETFGISGGQMAESFAFDGANYLVPLVNYQGATRMIGTKRVTPGGIVMGGFVSTGRTGTAANVAFDGTNHLLVWEDNGMGSLNAGTNWQVYGQFIRPTGSAASSPFAITSVGIQLDGIKTLAYGGGAYLMTYTRFPGDGSRYIAGRIIHPNGTMGDEFRISSGIGKAADIATDGTNFLVIWCEDENDTEIRGRIIDSFGNLGPEFSVNASGHPSDNPNSVIFNGQSYMVVWNDEVGGYGSGQWDIYGQLVSPLGALVGAPFAIVTSPGGQLPVTISSDGTQHLLAWLDMSGFNNIEMYGTYIDLFGNVGATVPLATGTGNQTGGVGFAGGKFLVIINDGVTFDAQGQVTGLIVSKGMFIDGPNIVRLQLQQSTDLNTWTPIQVTPGMIGQDGKLTLPVGENPAFYRMGIQVGG